ncbi:MULTISPECIES: alpha-xylosidase [unclassified Streptomyces]|jgi:alpha-D-xyloside xylohydrolase|uniref:alpha-xylosidase n=1 Tax=unclassified Streptomyces TaxID=2593676 RepID=UPI00087F7767|nr:MULTISPECIES: alpha-xylosidase [unclassified Streptomyces]MDX2733367.1 alpha-xylosidase [Streptomyces sp. PA03-2a]SCZ16591.1 alpha-D-xyloside xylohydrolase [Streptomyces sp. 136MFCol5.1]
MKFTDGFWLMREGVRACYATEVRDLRVDADRFTAYAAVKQVHERGDTLNTPLITVDCFSPAEGIIGVRTTHHAGKVNHGPDFEFPGLDTTTAAARARRDGAATELTSGPLTLRMNGDGPWGMTFLDARGSRLTAVDSKGTAFATTPDGAHHMIAQLALDVGENVYGLGERFTPYVKNGQTVDIWQADGGTSSEQAYKNIPFYLSSRGYGVFVNHPGKVSFEIGSESVGQVQFSVEDQSLEYYIVAGPTPKDILARYTALTGRPALPPAWSFGLWLTTSFCTSYDEETVSSFVDGMAERDIPLSVFHFDCFWMREYQWSDFQWDPDVFPDPAGMLARLKERGLRISMWINPYIAQKSPLFAEGAEHGYLVRRPGGDIWQWDLWQPGMALVDFTNPAAREWYNAKLRVLLDQGVDCFKTDFGERVPTDVVWHDGSDPERMHNYYAQIYNRTVFELLEKERGHGEAVLFARSATAGGQQFPVHWGGDCFASFTAMAESLRGGLSLSLSGFGFWSHDIGGFEGTPDPAVFKRWLAFGLLSSHSRLHGNVSYRVPWAFGDEAVDVARKFTLLKHRLMPYLYGVAAEAHRTGIPMMRPMLLEFPADPTTRMLDRQYMLGPDLLVAPVFTEDGQVEYYVPEGTWTHLLTGESVTGPAWRHETHGYDSLPLLVRPGAVLPWGADDQRPDGDWLDGLTLRVFGPATSTTDTVVTSVDLTGTAAAVFRVVRDSASGSTWVTAEGTDRPYRVIVEETGATGQGAGTVEVATV